jgi:hypothetical protein
MIKAGDVMYFLCPQGGWVTRGQEYEGIEWTDGKPLISKEEFEAGWIAYQAAQIAEAEAKAEAKAGAQAKLAALGLTVSDLEALGL